jgi:tetrahydrodipicolinate N-succinyltransferase
MRLVIVKKSHFGIHLGLKVENLKTCAANFCGLHEGNNWSINQFLLQTVWIGIWQHECGASDARRSINLWTYGQASIIALGKKNRG